MSVFKLYKGKRITAKHPKYSQARWWVYRRVKGHKTIHQSIPEARTREQAELAERKLIDERFNRKFGIADTKTTFAGFVDDVYSKYVQQRNVNLGAKRLYCETLKKHFGKRALSSITAQDCRDVQYALQHAKNQKQAGGRLSPSSVNRIMSTASRIFSLACEEGILDRSPMQHVRALAEPPPRNRLLTTEEKERLWMVLQRDTLLLRLVTLAVHLPLRRGQILAITKDAIDLSNGLLLAPSSKGKPARVVPMNATAGNTLRSMIADGQLPFPLKDFRKRWNRATVAAGINKKGAPRGENFTFHDLRHEMASELIRRNVNPEIVRKLFGHSDMSITQVYMNADAGMLSDAVNRLDAPNVQLPQEMEGPAN